MHAADYVPVWMPQDMPQPVHALPLQAAVEVLRCLTLLLGTCSSSMRLRVRLRRRFRMPPVSA